MKLKKELNDDLNNMTFGHTDLKISKLNSSDEKTKLNFISGEKSSKFTLSYYSRSPI